MATACLTVSGERNENYPPGRPMELVITVLQCWKSFVSSFVMPVRGKLGTVWAQLGHNLGIQVFPVFQPYDSK
jgi:hypothetical protein